MSHSEIFRLKKSSCFKAQGGDTPKHIPAENVKG